MDERRKKKRGQSTDKHEQQGIHKQNTAADQKMREANPAQASPREGHDLAVNCPKESSKPTKANISISDLLFENGKRKEQNV